ncbi:MAG: gliding motility-associated C-terminal domain-containing protein, partial [Bacteroidia bacterium]
INNRCGIAVDSFLASVINSPKISLGADSIFCDNLSYPMNIGTNSNKETYLWDDGTTSNSRTFINPGIYWAQIDNKCDIVRDTVEIELKHSPTVNLPQDSVFCDGISYVLDADIAEPSDYLWNTGSTDSAILVSSTGKYHVTISNHCGTVQDSITLGLITTPRVELGGDSVFCGGVSPLTYTVGKQNNEEVYLWSNGHTGNSTSFTTLGKHWVMLSNKCGTDSDTVEYKVSEYPTVDLGPDTTLCGNFSLTLDAGNPGMTYVWEPFDENTQTIQATEQRVYKVTVINDNGCEGSDEMEVKPDCISKSFIPSGFTPNGDGLNDVFRPTLINYESYTLKVYNRWGEKIYEGHNAEEGWDGTYQGKIVPNGVYTYVMQYKTTEDLQWQNIGGVLNVIR